MIKSTFIDTNNHFITEKSKKNKEFKVEDIKSKANHYFIMTEGGNPIWSRYSDEMDLSGMLATFSAMITKFNYSMLNKIQETYFLKSNSHTTIFLKKGGLYLIAVTKNNLSPSRIKHTLELLYSQLLSIITSDRIPFIERKPSLCAEAMSGTESMFEQTITYSHNNLPCILSSYEVVIFDNLSRKKLKQILKNNIGEALISLCITKQGVLAYSTSDYIEVLHYSDVLLIYNMLQSSESLSITESWAPICLPCISDSGYLQMYCNFYQVDGDISVGFIYITESQEPNFFMNFSEQCRKVFKDCCDNNLFIEIEEISGDDLNNNNNNNNNTENKNENNNTDTISTLPIKSKLHTAYEYRRKKNKNSEFNNNTETYLDNDDLLFDEVLNKLSFSYLKINSNFDLFDETYYLACRHKTLNQCFCKGFNDYNEVTHSEKKIMKAFFSLYENYLTSDKKMTNNYFYYETNSITKSVNCIVESESFLLIASLSLFKNFEEANNIMNEIAKQIKNNMMQYFIV